MLSLIFGAGASYGSEPKGVSTPPLGNYLFDELEKLNGAFFRLPEDIKEEFRVNGFEQGMLAIPNDSSIISPLQNELAVYLSAFKPSEDNVYVQLFRMLGDLVSDINLMTLNYDLLIEQALAICGADYVDYGLHKGRVSLLKVHGSSNFVPDVAGFGFGGILAINCGSFLKSSKIKILNSHEEIKRWCASEDVTFLSPIMCMYNKDKRGVINSDMLSAFKQDFSKAIDESETIIIVGVKYVQHDNHIWDGILATKSHVIIIDPSPDKALIEQLEQRKVNVIVIRKFFSDSVVRLSGIIRKSIRVAKSSKTD